MIIFVNHSTILEGGLPCFSRTVSGDNGYHPQTLTDLPALVSGPRHSKEEALRISSTFVTGTGVRLVAPSVRDQRAPVQTKGGSANESATFSTELVDPETSTTVGTLRWFEGSQVLGGPPPDDPDPCTVEDSSWCPAECTTCNRTYY
jgi:hypothetical protein